MPEEYVLDIDGGQRVFGVTCDGWVKSTRFDIVAEGPEAADWGWQARVGGWLDRRVSEPIHTGNTDGEGGTEIIVGPFAFEKDGSPLLELRVFGADGKPPKGLSRLLIPERPIDEIWVDDFDGDGCDEVALLPKPTQIWDPNEGLADCRPDDQP